MTNIDMAWVIGLIAGFLLGMAFVLIYMPGNSRYWKKRAVWAETHLRAGQKRDRSGRFVK